MSPAVRRAVLEHHVDPTKIKGTGKRRPADQGRRDRRGAGAEGGSSPARPAAQPGESAAAPAAQPASLASPAARGGFGERREERVKMSRLRQTIAKRLKEAQNTAALLTTFNDVDMSAVIDARAATRICSRRSTASASASWASS
jgi:2-oxoglutarate dehydrogenase E2 component (dihydrolipoamide succinyltransferase)